MKEIKAYDNVVVDISSGCNDICKWCSTGIKNQKLLSEQIGDNVETEGNKEKCKIEFMTSEEMQKGVEYLINKNIITSNANFVLYNWGEPLLNPDLCGILDVLCAKNMRYTLSSNGSKVVEFTDAQLTKLENLLFTISGFSSETYRKTQSGDFNKIISNITEMTEKIRKQGYNDKVKLYYLLYQFNCDEIDAARSFCEKLGIELIVSYAHFADFNFCNEFISNPDGEVHNAASKDIFTYYMDEVIASRPAEYLCPQKDSIVFDRHFNIIPCCRLTINSVLGNLFSCSLEKIEELKKGTKECKLCQKNGQDYLIHNIPTVKKQSIGKNKNGMFTFFYDTGNGFNGEEVIGKTINNFSILNSVRVEFPQPVKNVRFDPIEGCGCIIKNFKINAKKQSRYKVVNGIVFEDTILINNTDPQIIIEFEESVESIIIEAEVIAIQ